jgi:DNA-binding LacI/PurR family transcriptional regulator
VTIEQRTRQPVIDDVAKLAGVSVPTVSRVLTGAARVSDDKRQRVVDAIRELNFRPNAVARALANRQPKLVAVLAANTSHYGNAATLEGIEEAARAAGYVISITVVESSEHEVVRETVALAVGQPIAGVIVLEFDEAGTAALRSVPPSVPMVSIAGNGQAATPHVELDESQAAFDLTSHLLDLGHHTVHHVKIPSGPREDGRTLGWRRALQARGAPVPPVEQATWEPASGHQIGRHLATDPSVTAIFCGNDEIAIGVMAGATEIGRRVPADLSVAGFDDHPLAAFVTPPLTTVRQDFVALGYRAFQLLQDDLVDETRGPNSLIEEPNIVLRSSVGPPRR